MTVIALPPNGTVLLADGLTPVRPRQVLTLAQLEALKFRPALSSTAGSQAFGFSTTNPAGVVVDAEARLPAGYSVLSVPQDSGARTIGIQISSATDHLAPETCAIITGLPSNGTVLLADGMTSVTQGQTLTAVQLKRLRFRPAIDAVGQISDLHYLIVGPTGGALAGCVLLIVRPAAPPLSATARSAPDPASVAESSSAGSAGPAARLETRLSSGSSSKLLLSVAADGKGRQEAREPCTAVGYRHAGARPRPEGQARTFLNWKPSAATKCFSKLPLMMRHCRKSDDRSGGVRTPPTAASLVCWPTSPVLD